MKVLERIAITFMGLAFLGEMNMLMGREVIHDRPATIYILAAMVFIFCGTEK